MNDTTTAVRAAPAQAEAGRRLTFHILRYNPQDKGSAPRMQTYELEEAEGMTLFIALNEIREKQDPTLQFDFVCRAGICGSCAMMVNGRPRSPAARSPATSGPRSRWRRCRRSS